MNYEETLEYIHKVSWTGSRPGLTRIEELLRLLGNPQDGLRFVHVAGTNGKGSFCAMCDSVLRRAGYRTGLYTSPYIERFNERIAVNGEPIPDDELSRITEYVKGFAEGLDDPPTEFELITAVAMVYFAEQKCDPVVLEVGMGGRLDATNIIKTPLLSVITGISLDHTAVLGDSVEKIAAEKAGIIKPGVPVLYGGIDADAERVIRDTAVKKSSEYHCTRQYKLKLISATLDGSRFEYDGDIYEIGLLGLYQPHNAANVIEAVKLLRLCDLNIDEKALRAGLAEASWRGRFELLSRSPVLLTDGSHNPEGIEAAVQSIKYYFGEKKVCLLTGVMKDKDYPKMAAELSQIACCAVALKPNNPRALGSEPYAAEFIRNGIEAYGSTSIREAVAKAYELAVQKEIPVVALGSLYMYGDIKAAAKEIFAF